MNIKRLTSAISEHIGHQRVKYLNENSFILNSEVLNLNNGLLRSKRFAFRFTSLKNMLISLRDGGVFSVNDETINHIINRYRHLETESNALQALIAKYHAE
jgi:hypothetical protein